MVHFVRQFGVDLYQAFGRFQANHGLTLAAATAYYVGLSFFPLLLVLTAGLGWFLQSTNLGQDAEQRVIAAISENTSPVLAQYVGDALAVVQQNSAVSGPIGLATMLIAALGAFIELDWAFDQIWDAKPRQSTGVVRIILAFLMQRGRAFLLLLGVGVIVLLVFISGMVMTGVQAHTEEIVPVSGWVWNTLQIGVTFALNTLVFTLLNRLLPKANVRWRAAFGAGLLTALAWEIGRQALAAYVVRANYTSAYGVIGAFLGVLLWCYYAVIIVLLGAAYARVLQDRRFGASPSAGAP